MGLPSIGPFELLLTALFPIAIIVGVVVIVIRVLDPSPWQPYTGPDRDRQAAALLAFFVGTIGAHKLYLRRWVEAALYPIFFWTGIPTVLGVLEGIWYLSMSDEAFRRRVVERRPVAADTTAGWGGRSRMSGDVACIACGTSNPVDARFCLRCGSATDPYTGPACPACGAGTVPGALHCTACGVRLASTD